MSTRMILALAAIVACAAQPVVAQPTTTVQLPTFSFFTVNTTVSVPDRGSMLMGGINSAASGINEFGVPLMPFGNRAIGGSRSSSQVRVSAYIHDFEAMDEYLLNGAGGGGGPLTAPYNATGTGKMLLPRDMAASRSWQAPQPALPASGPSVAQVQSQRAIEQRTKADEATDFFARGQQAEADGKPNVAKIYYQMVARRAAGDLRDKAVARLEVIGANRTGSQVAQGGSR